MGLIFNHTHSIIVSKGQSIHAWEDVKETMRSFSLQDFHAARLKTKIFAQLQCNASLDYLPVLQVGTRLLIQMRHGRSWQWTESCQKEMTNQTNKETRNDQTLHSSAKRIMHKSTRRTGLGEEDPKKNKEYLHYLHHASSCCTRRMNVFNKHDTIEEFARETAVGATTSQAMTKSFHKDHRDTFSGKENHM